jgi:tellurite resistance protein TehA-like permease
VTKGWTYSFVVGLVVLVLAIIFAMRERRKHGGRPVAFLPVILLMIGSLPGVYLHARGIDPDSRISIAAMIFNVVMLVCSMVALLVVHIFPRRHRANE